MRFQLAPLANAWLLSLSKLLTPKCPPRDFRVRARTNSTKSRLYRFKTESEVAKLAGIRREIDSSRLSHKSLLRRRERVAVLGGFCERVSTTQIP